MKNNGIKIVIIMLVVIAILHYLKRTPQLENEKVIKEPKNPITILDSAQIMNEHGTANSDLESDLEMLHTALKTYRKVYKQNPIGLNDEITSALTGKNPKAIAFIPPKHTSIIDQELTDRHGTPYHFHANTGKNITIRSAGKDKQLFTEDDAQYESK